MATEYSTDRTKHTEERRFEQVGKVSQGYVLKNTLNTHSKLNPAVTIQYYSYSNVQRFHFEYIVPLGTGSNLANDLNNKSSKSKTIMKGGKVDNMSLLKELWKVELLQNMGLNLSDRFLMILSLKVCNSICLQKIHIYLQRNIYLCSIG